MGMACIQPIGYQSKLQHRCTTIFRNSRRYYYANPALQRLEAVSKRKTSEAAGIGMPIGSGADTAMVETKCTASKVSSCYKFRSGCKIWIYISSTGSIPSSSKQFRMTWRTAAIRASRAIFKFSLSAFKTEL